MPLLTFVARVTDGMLLVASMELNHTTGAGDETMDLYKSQAKQIFKKLNPRSVSKCSLESGAYTFHYLIEHGICYLTLCDKGFPKRLAFLYLEEIHQEFVAFLEEKEAKDSVDEKRPRQDWTRQVELVARPYYFIKFDKNIKKKVKDFANPSSRSNASRLNDDLSDIHSIMKKNINEVLKRGENIDHMQDVTSNLKQQSSSFRWGAKKVSLMAQWQQYAPFVAVAALLIFVLILKFYF
mmetsp:Transcript_23911/g.53974  ORF Transcript_23911/g.53974 Transcript_23911/m.53974 type:complete len:238 (+) Transcript_23911:164-877(+)